VFNLGSALSYHGGAFVGEHSSWNRPHLNGYKVVYVPFADGHPNGPPGCRNRFPQPGRKIAWSASWACKSGNLLIADDVGNTVWRVSAAGNS
jgi:glucose/arabinose dehydrogenase